MNFLLVAPRNDSPDLGRCAAVRGDSIEFEREVFCVCDVQQLAARGLIT